jgi:hypothetical protein
VVVVVFLLQPGLSARASRERKLRHASKCGSDARSAAHWRLILIFQALRNDVLGFVLFMPDRDDALLVLERRTTVTKVKPVPILDQRSVSRLHALRPLDRRRVLALFHSFAASAMMVAAALRLGADLRDHFLALEIAHFLNSAHHGTSFVSNREI